MCEKVALAQLIEQLGHDDDSYIDRFIRNPDDGRGLFPRCPLFARLRRFTPGQADRIRERFT